MNKLIIPPKIERLFEKNPSLFTRGHDFVEIGGVKWATCNIGAKKPTDPGLYFQWGDTRGYTAEQVRNGEKRFIWDDYLFTRHTFVLSLNKYNLTDNKTMLDVEDDAVHAAWGGAWRMPTGEDFDTLVYNTKVTTFWSNNYQDSGVAGLVCADRTDSSKELFFPAVGYCYMSSNFGVNTDGFYWSKSFNNNSWLYSYSLMFNRIKLSNRLIDNLISISSRNRFFGFPIRGVLDI